jgi:hypothetical protein
MYDAARPMPRFLPSFAIACAALACGVAEIEAPILPPAEVFDEPCDFSGQWTGEIGGRMGSLRITRLQPTRYRGQFDLDGGGLRFVLSLDQTTLPRDGKPAPTNLASFTWQDGRGGLGVGWLLVNREGTALTGEFGEGPGHSGGSWNFIREE